MISIEDGRLVLLSAYGIRELVRPADFAHAEELTGSSCRVYLKTGSTIVALNRASEVRAAVALRLLPDDQDTLAEAPDEDDGHRLQLQIPIPECRDCRERLLFAVRDAVDGELVGSYERCEACDPPLVGLMDIGRHPLSVDAAKVTALGVRDGLTTFVHMGAEHWKVLGGIAEVARQLFGDDSDEC